MRVFGKFLSNYVKFFLQVYFSYNHETDMMFYNLKYTDETNSHLNSRHPPCLTTDLSSISMGDLTFDLYNNSTFSQVRLNILSW